MKVTRLALAVALALTPAAVFAQSTTTPATPSTAAATAPAQKPMDIQQRKVNQQKRIAQGIKSGELKPGQTARLEHQEAGINKEERGMKAQDNGKLTRADRKLINKQQNQESRRIYRDKHPAAK